MTPAEVPHIGLALSAITSTADYQREWQFRRKDGSVFAAEVIATMMPDGNLLAMVHDLTERMEAARALQSAEERMRFALESAKVGIWDMDYASGVLTWSKAVEGHYGVPAGTFAGTFDAFMERVPSRRSRSLLVAAIGKAMKAGAEFVVTNQALWPDEDAFAGLKVRGGWSWTGTASPSGQRHFTGCYRAANAPRSSITRSRRWTQHRSHLAGGVAHDFNNMLTAILGYC